MAASVKAWSGRRDSRSAFVGVGNGRTAARFLSRIHPRQTQQKEGSEQKEGRHEETEDAEPKALETCALPRIPFGVDQLGKVVEVPPMLSEERNGKATVTKEEFGLIPKHIGGDASDRKGCV
jgi:hypothetical protein